MIISYFTAGERNFASSRLRCWKIGDELQKMGHTVAWNIGRLDTDVAVVQKRTDKIEFMESCRRRGIRVVFDFDDYMPDLPFSRADIVTTDTRGKLPLWPQAIIVPDALDVEQDGPRKTEHAEHLKHVVTVLNADNMYHISNAAQACQQLGLELTVITDLNHRAYAHFDGVHGLAWDIKTVDAELVKADLFIAPFVEGGWSVEWVNSKSANRLYKAHALGLPVAGTPIPSYKEAGLFWEAQTLDDWISVFSSAQSRELREQDAHRGYLMAQQFRADKVALQWLEVFRHE